MTFKNGGLCEWRNQVKDKVTHPVSTGFCKTISAADPCLSTGLVSLIGWGEAGLEPGAPHWGPKERGRGRGKGGMGQSRGIDRETELTVRMTSIHLFLSAVALSPPRGDMWEMISVNAEDNQEFSLSTCCWWLVPVKRVWVGDWSNSSPHFLLIFLLRHRQIHLVYYNNNSTLWCTTF